MGSDLVLAFVAAAWLATTICLIAVIVYLLRGFRRLECTLTEVLRRLDPSFSTLGPALPPRARRRLLTPRISWRPKLTYLAIAHVVLLGLWLWSHAGAMTDVRLVVQGNTYSAFIDGQPAGVITTSGPPTGGVAVDLPPSQDATPGGPTPEVRWVHVRDLDSGATLLDDDFSGQTAWTSDQGPRWQGGRPPAAGGRITIGPRPWTDYEVEVLVSNAASMTTYARFQDGGDNVSFWVRPWRHQDFSLTAKVGNQQTDGLGGLGRFSPIQTVRAMLERLLRPYPFVLIGTLLLVLAAAVARRRRAPYAAPHMAVDDSIVRKRRLPAFAILAVVGVLTVATISALSYLQLHYLQGIPHVPDSSIYLMQARWFASGILVPPAPTVPKAFDIFGSYVSVVKGHWVSQYPFGHPLLLAIGWALGAVWLVNPVIAALCIPLLYLLARGLYGSGSVATGTGLAASVLLAASPFFQMNGVDFMSHSTGAFFLLIALVSLVALVHACSRRRMILTGVACGAAVGMLFNTRPLTAVGVAVFLAVVCLVLLVRNRSLLPGMVGIGAGGLALLLAYFAYNAALTGDPLLNPYSFSGTFSTDALGFAGANTFERALRNTHAQLVLLELVQFGWPSGVFFGLALVPIVVPHPDRRDLFLIGVVLAAIGAWFFYDGTYIMYGPRFWLEIAPLLVLITTRGLFLICQYVADTVRLFARPSAQPAVRWASALALTGIVVGLAAASLVWWWAPANERRPVENGVPTNISDLRGFNFADDRLDEAVREAGIHNAVVMVSDCGGWWCYGSVFWRNAPLLNGDVVYAQDKPDTRADLVAAYPGRSFYVADWKTRSLQLLSSAELPR